MNFHRSSEFVTRRAFAIGALGLALTPGLVRAQERVRRIGLLFGTSRDLPEVTALYRAWIDGMRDLGWVEGRNFVIEYREARGDFGRLDGLAKELADLKVDLIFAPTAVSVGAARRATSTIPIVVAAHSNPVGSGDIASLARPGGNVTGLSSQAIETGQKALDLLKQAMPGLSRIARIRHDPFESAVGAAMEVAAMETATNLGVQLEIAAIRELSDLDEAFARFARTGVQAVLQSSDLICGTTYQKRLIWRCAIGFRWPPVFGSSRSRVR